MCENSFIFYVTARYYSKFVSLLFLYSPANSNYSFLEASSFLKTGTQLIICKFEILTALKPKVFLIPLAAKSYMNWQAPLLSSVSVIFISQQKYQLNCKVTSCCLIPVRGVLQ